MIAGSRYPRLLEIEMIAASASVTPSTWPPSPPANRSPSPPANRSPSPHSQRRPLVLHHRQQRQTGGKGVAPRHPAGLERQRTFEGIVHPGGAQPERRRVAVIGTAPALGQAYHGGRSEQQAVERAHPHDRPAGGQCRGAQAPAPVAPVVMVGLVVQRPK